eukprot:764163_1
MSQQQNRQWELPSKAGRGGGRRRKMVKKKASTPIVTSTTPNSSFANARTMWENKSSKPTKKNTSNTHMKKSNPFNNARSMFESTSNTNTNSKPKPIKPSKPIQSPNIINKKPSPNKNIPTNNNNNQPPP